MVTAVAPLAQRRRPPPLPGPLAPRAPRPDAAPLFPPKADAPSNRTRPPAVTHATLLASVTTHQFAGAGARRVATDLRPTAPTLVNRSSQVTSNRHTYRQNKPDPDRRASSVVRRANSGSNHRSHSIRRARTIDRRGSCEDLFPASEDRLLRCEACSRSWPARACARLRARNFACVRDLFAGTLPTPTRNAAGGPPSPLAARCGRTRPGAGLKP